MKFEIGGNYSADDEQNKFYIADDDISLMYNTTLPYDYIYSIFLSEDWRYEIIADSDTGRCVQFQCHISCLNAEFLSLTIPKSERKELLSLWKKAQAAIMSPFRAGHSSISKLKFCA